MNNRKKVFKEIHKPEPSASAPPSAPEVFEWVDTFTNPVFSVGGIDLDDLRCEFEDSNSLIDLIGPV